MAQLQAEGHQARWVPAIEIRALRPSSLAGLRQLSDGSVLFAVSGHALAQLVHLAAELPNVTVNCWVPGRATAQTAQRIADGLPLKMRIFHDEDGTSEGLLRNAHFQSQVSESGQLLILAGEGGRRVLETQLSAAGTSVDRIELYRRQPRPLGNRDLHLLRALSGDIRTQLSSEAAITAIEHWPADILSMLKSQGAHCPSARLLAIARRYGWNHAHATGPNRDDET